MLTMPWKESKTRVQKAEDGDASQKKKKKNVRKESRCRAQNNTQEDRKLRDKYCAENRWRSHSEGRNRQLGGKGQVERGERGLEGKGWEGKGEGRVGVEGTRQMTNCD